MARWSAAFIDEVGLDEPSDPDDVARERIRESSLFIWEDEQPVSMAAWAGRTGRMVRINYVYTPPEHRGRGYASACVASLTQQLLDKGFARCCLYTALERVQLGFVVGVRDVVRGSVREDPRTGRR